ncbi:GlsB/YeaQ/YmgE family stress response membrane protein [Candidatus Sulfurimonas baltica]|uniref:GlsB/YeaQ/YmgE family stress response membrane protein n=1 Tax=Candidatus Sulfurimonas baltica TaxID=2740404 RepID=A0A7S7RN96_9BACT|nr:GlsB/YeaQ/YmgE family stress response membrane protein [Candidatus Sulfurimonas baltica]QOY52319.1 GlsB/YeaQ/YmgE family stress response membrane protein [Candidatus Sulfurimonas baltica]
MDIINLIIFLAVGALAGWLAGIIMKGRGFGVISNIIVGIVGALLGGFVFGLLGITTGGFLGSIVMATIGAVILLYMIKILKKV